jgi:hypothetical protein
LEQANFGENQGSFEEIKEKIEKYKAALKNVEHVKKQRKSNARNIGKKRRGKAVTKWKNCSGAVESGQPPTWRMVGSWTSRD